MSDRPSVFTLSYTLRPAPFGNVSGGRLGAMAIAAVTVAGVSFVAGCSAINTRPSGSEQITDSGWGAPPPVAVPENGDAPLDATDAERLVNQYAEGSLAAGNQGESNPIYEPTRSRDRFDPRTNTNTNAGAQDRTEASGVIWDEPSPAANRERVGYRAASDATSRAFGTTTISGNASRETNDANQLPQRGVSIPTPRGGANVYTAGGREAVTGREAVLDRRGIDSGTTAAELFETLARMIEESNDHDLVKAVRLDALALVDPMAGEALRLRSDPSENLDADQKKIAALYRDVIKLIGEELSGNDVTSGPGTLAELKARFDALDGANPLSVKRAELCRSVRGFGVYDPFESNTFVAGRSQPMIIYLELDHFSSKRVSGTDHEVKLTQEVEIYNKADGLLVWRKKPDQIVDRSRNQRRDFFTVQMIEVPARLTVGQFTIKVRVTDHHGNALDETNIPLNMVADRSLTSRLDSVLK